MGHTVREAQHADPRPSGRHSYKDTGTISVWSDPCVQCTAAARGRPKVLERLPGETAKRFEEGSETGVSQLGVRIEDGPSKHWDGTIPESFRLALRC